MINGAANDVSQFRRQLLKFALGSPLLYALTGNRLLSADQTMPGPDLSAEQLSGLINSPEQALNVFDFEAVAAKVLPPAHYGFLKSGAGDDSTVRENRAGLMRHKLRLRRLTGVDTVDTTCSLFGESWQTPIALAPVGSQRAFHVEGEIATARAARELGQQMILSTASSTAIEDVVAARAAPVWFQLYALSPWELTESIIHRAEAAESSVLVLTVDVFFRGKKETFQRYSRIDNRECSACHQSGPLARFLSKPMIREATVGKTSELRLSNPTWELVKQIRNSTAMKLVIKGIETAEDAAIAMEYGVDGIIVSNHGGRAIDSARATIDSLPEVVAEVNGRMPVLVDGGFRRGSDIFKAIALGANAVCIGRPYLWGLGAFGQEGVEQVLRLLRAEFELVMRQAGVRSISEISSFQLARYQASVVR